MTMGFLARLHELARHRGAPSAVCGAGPDWSYGQLAAAVYSAFRCLEQQGIGPGSAVGITLGDEAEHLVATLALLARGARQIVLATHDPAASRQLLAARVGLTHHLTRPGCDPVQGAIEVAWPQVGAHAEAPAGAMASARPSGSLVLRTSGTTGEVNLVAFDEAQIAAQAERHADYRHERLLRLASIEHNNSKRHRLYCVWAGGTNVFRSHGEDLMTFIESQRVTCLDISRIHAADLADSSDAHRLAGTKLRTGGSSMPFSLRRAVIERCTRQLYVRYAATECGAISMALPGEHDADETAGRPLPGIELQVVDADGRPLPDGERGEIRLRAPGMATGYLDNPGQTAQRFREGWFHPGDVGLLRRDGHLVVLGRCDDMIVLNGLNIFPLEIERVLEQNPAVAEAAALPLPSPVHGQIPVAAVVLRPGADLPLAELRRHCHEQLGLRAPRRLLVIERMPKNGQGKTLKKELVDMFQALSQK